MRESELFKFLALGVGSTLVTLGIVLLIFREVVCWYWKINESIGLLRSIDRHLLRLVAEQQMGARTSTGRGSEPSTRLSPVPEESSVHPL